MILIDHDLCDLCGTCVGVCPVDCISMSDTTLNIDDDTCIQCNFCIQVCPMEALKEEKDD
ncbi:MAG: 4Fe-4S binding protein [Candidatus Marinimicrobia bacterium]|nr:4Fe-4S binding protein [Candidatus Neomarinimicrobiota bacterium]